MSEEIIGGLDVDGGPGEGGSGVSEQLSENARQKFAAAAAAMQQIKREEKQSKKRDDQVANAIIQFLGDEGNAHLFTLIARLVARNCPSIFILAILSLIHEGCQQAVQEYLKESGHKSAEDAVDESMALTKTGELDPDVNKALVSWITRMQMVLSMSSGKIIARLMVDEKNIDGSVLQLTTFVLQDFFEERKKAMPFEKLQPLTASIMQAVLQPFMKEARKVLAEASAEEEDDIDEV